MKDRPSLMELAAEKVIVLDGAMGTTLQSCGLGPDDFGGFEGCNEVLVRTRPDVVRSVHAGFFEAGCDVVETNTFGANDIVLVEYGLAGEARELNRLAASLAREAADSYSSPGHPRFVLGSVGPGTRLPSLGHIGFDDLVAAFRPQFDGLLLGGADALCIETCQDLLQVRAALFAARDAMREGGRKLPLFVSVTIESTGTMLVGSDVQAAIASLWPLGIDVLGLNCATGPSEMKRHVEHLQQFGPPHIMAMPNAGLPVNVGGELVYTLSPAEFAAWVAGFVRENEVGFVGGCCGTTAAHLAALSQAVGGLPAPRRQRSRPAEVSSLFQAVPMRQEPAPLLVGERTNANGSSEFRRHLIEDDVDGMLAVAREQEKGGAHLLDVSVAYAGRDEVADMTAFAGQLVRTNRLPLCIDSTTPEVIEAALKLSGGRCLINSINLEDGWERLDRLAALAKAHGAAVIALTIDENEMAMTAEHKLEVAERIFQRCTVTHGLSPQDLVFDMLTFTVASGDPSTRRAAVETLDAIGEFRKRHPDALTILGVSNVSFGLKPAARRVLNSVFLHLAVERGLDQAIVNARRITPLYRISQTRREAAHGLLMDDRSEGDPLAAYMALFDGPRGARTGTAGKAQTLPPQERVQQMVVDGISKGVPELLDKLVDGGMAPVEIINEVLIAGMKEVGVLFGSGQMQLPFVLQSAEVMKRAVQHLESFMEGDEVPAQGTLVLATVKGDVHDIGKNLVEIIVSNNGYRVVNLGTKIEVEEMMRAATKHNATAIGMSGLLVKSTNVMRENLQEMKRRGMSVPVLLGGAALTRDFVERDLALIYDGPVFYCPDAFAGLEAMSGIAGSHGASTVSSSSSERKHGNSGQLPTAPDPVKPDLDHSHSIPAPPFEGTAVLDDIPVEEVFELLNELTLFRGQWRYRRGKLSREAFEEMTSRVVRPTLARLKAECLEKGRLTLKAVYGYFPCFSRGDEVVVLGPDGRELATFPFPRSGLNSQQCLADFFRSEESGERDVIGFFLVTAGAKVMEEVERLYRADRYQDYLHLHGLAVESAEAAAEWMHRRMRAELRIAGQNRPGHQGSGPQGFRGSRYSFGYPSCPDLSGQTTLFKLLDPARIGVGLSEGMQMVPEASVSAIVVHHPQARS